MAEPRFLYVFHSRNAPPGQPIALQVFHGERPTRAMLRDLAPVEYHCRLPDALASASLDELERWYLDAKEYGGLPEPEKPPASGGGSKRKLGHRHRPLRTGEITVAGAKK